MAGSLHSRQRLLHLDGLRGAAAVAVMLYHVHNLFGLNLGFERCYLFVDVFFMLSGFVLSRAWSQDFAQHVDSQILLRARIRRLWPMMAIASLLGAAVHLLLNDVQNVVPLLLLALLLIPFIGHSGAVYPLNGPQWSILWELFANLVHVRWFRRLATPRLLVVGLLMGLFTSAAIVVCGANTSGPNGDLWWLTVARVGWSYLIGMLFASYQQTAHWRTFLSWQQALALFVIAVLILPLLPLATSAGDIIFTIVISPALFWLLVTARGPVSAGQWLSKLGALSFPLYATHLPLLTMWAALDMPKATAAALGVTSSLCLSACLSGSSDHRRAKRQATPPRSRLEMSASLIKRVAR